MLLVKTPCTLIFNNPSCVEPNGSNSNLLVKSHTTRHVQVQNNDNVAGPEKSQVLSRLHCIDPGSEAELCDVMQTQSHVALILGLRLGCVMSCKPNELSNKAVVQCEMTCEPEFFLFEVTHQLVLFQIKDNDYHNLSFCTLPTHPRTS